MINWRIRDIELRAILQSNNDPDNEFESVANTKQKLIPYLKNTKHFRGLSPNIIRALEKSQTFHAFNIALDKVWDWADQNSIWIDFINMNEILIAGIGK